MQPVLATVCWPLWHRLGSLEPRRSGLAYQRFRKLEPHTKLGMVIRQGYEHATQWSATLPPSTVRHTRGGTMCISQTQHS